MRVHFDNCNFSARTGPNTFAKRLAEQFIINGVSLSGWLEPYDVMLSFIEASKLHRSGTKLVQRLDGIWFKPNEFIEKNAGIKATYDKADLVVWQSEFDKNMSIHHWGEPKNGVVIRNGINLSRVEEITASELLEMRDKYEMVFVCSSNWHAQKRLQSNIEMFDHIRKTMYPNSCLIVLGSNPDAIAQDSDVFYTGSVTQEVYMQVFAMANAMIHLAWLDHCPNVVIEALSQGTMVICSEAGGTKELVQDCGIVLKEQDDYKFQLIDYDKPPTIDVTQVTRELFESRFNESKMILGGRDDIDIVNVAKEYEKAFEELL
jgi:glycosyltransferase involved in cell wall biosynthesis